MALLRPGRRRPGLFRSRILHAPMATLYPLHGLPHQRRLWAWISFDVANQSFTLIINTLLFSIFFAEVVVRDKAVEARWWFATYGASMILTAALSPLVGAIADERRWRKAMLVGSGLFCGVLTCCLALVKPGQLWLAMLLYIPANLLFSLGENFLAAFLPALARAEQFGRVSGFSWACAYASALVLLLLTAGVMLWFGLEQPDSWRPFFVLAGLWFLAFTVPTVLWLPEPAGADGSHAGRSVWTVGFVRLGESLRKTGRHRDLAVLLVASLFYGTGMSVVVFFASKLASEYGFKEDRLVMFVAVITVSGVIGTLLPMKFQDRAGHRRSTIVFVAVWLLTTLGFAWYAHLADAHAASHPGVPFATWPLWIIGNLLGFGLGSLGSANRAFVGFLAPESRTAEVFGLWGLVFKLAAVLTFPFAWVKDTSGNAMALLVLAGFLVVGLVLTMLVDERRGRAAALGADGDATLPA